ncbi:hypothetical protein [Microbispora sp. ATCC PTA-5024]|uniref:hypothetical protein n=1 Tax=Microbispora sp. ATCC PTA-5024 TaxID=316330 RepID=UPI0003DDD68A|nr:hypothetical protein [Microbispora sp. ATCC PTA-5024]ETK32841.1 hypothetical protein MPTA5024_27525 [Microbispora sp. ATCC PTA-5024]
MTAAWVSGSTRARALVRRGLGLRRARELASCGSAAEAVAALARTSYGHDVRPGQSLPAAQWAVLATLLWHLRVLAGWLPTEGAQMVRVLARWFEIANVDELMCRFAGRPCDPELVLGSLHTAWPRLRNCASRAEVRATLIASPWGDPGGSTRRDIQLGMRLAWAARLADALPPPARVWVRGATALLVARERFAQGRELPAGARGRCRSLLGAGAAAATSIADMSRRLPPSARWALRDVGDPASLWTAERRWWNRVEDDGHALLAGSGFSADPVVGALAVLAADARRVRAALELAARGGAGDALD